MAELNHRVVQMAIVKTSTARQIVELDPAEDDSDDRIGKAEQVYLGRRGGSREVVSLSLTAHPQKAAISTAGYRNRASLTGLIAARSACRTVGLSARLLSSRARSASSLRARRSEKLALWSAPGAFFASNDITDVAR